MEAAAFAEVLAALAPTPEEMAKAGLSPSQAAELWAVPRKRPAPPSGDPLVDLVQAYDATKVCVGNLRFLGRVRHHERDLIVGVTEQDDSLIIDGESKEVRIEALGSANPEPVPCAQDGGRFLEALLPAARFFRRQVFEVCDLLPDEVGLAITRECAAIAGGDKYHLFYRYLLGC